MGKRKRRRFSASQKTEIVLAGISGEKSPAEICREYEISSQQYSLWKRQFLENATQVFEKPTPDGKADEIAELERMVGRLTMQLEIAKKASSLLTSAAKNNGKWS